MKTVAANLPQESVNLPQMNRGNRARHLVHVPSEFGRHAPDVPGYLPSGKLVDHLSSVENACVGVFVIVTLAIQYWQIVN